MEKEEGEIHVCKLAEDASVSLLLWTMLTWTRGRRSPGAEGGMGCFPQVAVAYDGRPVFHDSAAL
jgi:hypothetical protein